MSDRRLETGLEIEDLTSEERDRPTLKTIAQLSGFSVPTVSRALSDAPDIGLKTKKAVQELAEKLGYRRDRAAVRLRTGKTNVIALAIRTDHEVMNHSAKLIGSIAGTFRDTPYHLVVIPYFEDEDPLDPVKYIVRTGSADGIILNRVLPEDPRVAYLQEKGVPFALHGRTLDATNIPYCDFDNEAFGYSAVEFMAQRGRRRYLLVAPPLEQNYSQLILAGARRKCAEIGASCDVLGSATSDDPSEEVKARVAEALAAAPDTDAIITPSSPSSMAAAMAIEDLGRKLGQDIDIAAKEPSPFLKAFRKEILVTYEDLDQTGRFLAKALIDAIENPGGTAQQKLLLPSPFLP